MTYHNVFDDYMTKTMETRQIIYCPFLLKSKSCKILIQIKIIKIFFRESL